MILIFKNKNSRFYKYIGQKLETIFYLPIGLCIAAISFLVPKKKNLMLLIGRDEGKFLDNIKYFYQYLEQRPSSIEYYFVTEDKNINDYLVSKKVRSLYYPQRSTLWKMMRCNILVVDNVNWIDHFKRFLLIRTKRIQLWHGIGFKRIELANRNFKKNGLSQLGKFKLHTVYGRYPRYDAVISTSPFFTESIFSLAFKSQHFPVTGYPRNDIFFQNITSPASEIAADTNTINKVTEYKKQGNRILVYCPTFRDTGGDALSDNALNMEELNNFAKKHHLVFVFKFHPDPRFQTKGCNYERILWYENSCDIYPLLSKCDAMISDYSSIYLDFLLLNRPILLFWYDHAKYQEKDRDLLPFFSEFLAGPQFNNQTELQNGILQELFERDSYKSIREDILKRSFSFQDGDASKRILQFIENKFLPPH